MVAQGSIQHNPSQLAGTLQPPPLAATGVISGPSVPSQVSQPGVIPETNTVHILDSREEKPSSWDEVFQLQEALEPSIRSFARINAKTPPWVPGSYLLSYAEQVAILQSRSDKNWIVDRRRGAPPKLAKLAAWRGGISMIGKAKFRITEEMTEKFKHKKLCGTRPIYGSLGWYEETFSEQGHKQANGILAAADAREELQAQGTDGAEQQDVPESLTEILDNIVARDPERYLAWLSTMGYFYFMTDGHHIRGLPWEDWCKWQAPRSFETCCQPEIAVRRPPLGPGAIDRSKYGPPGERPTVTLKKAKKGNARAMEFEETANGILVSTREKGEYYMLGGEATSRQAAAHYHGIRGEDVRLFEPMESLDETQNDLSRRREAEVEASFGCWRH